jgi:hypothetical protein
MLSNIERQIAGLERKIRWKDVTAIGHMTLPEVKALQNELSDNLASGTIALDHARAIIRACNNRIGAINKALIG